MTEDKYAQEFEKWLTGKLKDNCFRGTELNTLAKAAFPDMPDIETKIFNIKQRRINEQKKEHQLKKTALGIAVLLQGNCEQEEYELVFQHAKTLASSELTSLSPIEGIRPQQ